MSPEVNICINSFFLHSDLVRMSLIKAHQMPDVPAALSRHDARGSGVQHLVPVSVAAVMDNDQIHQLQTRSLFVTV